MPPFEYLQRAAQTAAGEALLLLSAGTAEGGSVSRGVVSMVNMLATNAWKIVNPYFKTASIKMINLYSFRKRLKEHSF